MAFRASSVTRRAAPSLLLAMVLISACGPIAPVVECRLPLTQRQCDDALVRARAAVDQSAHLVLEDQARGEPIRLTEIWQACGDAGCMGHLAGFAFVRMQTDDRTSLGRVIVCVDTAVCGDEPITFGFP